ncbi:MAG: 2'-5' RNA ligase family protein [Nocardioidaceae bacterium]
MRLFAVIVPPSLVLDELREAVLAAQTPVTVPAPRRRHFGRLRGGTSGREPMAQASEASEASEGEFAMSAPQRMYLPITHFGNVTQGDSIRLAEALRAEAATWKRPQVHFSGSAALEWPGDQSVWAKLDGDLDDLMRIGRGVVHVSQGLGFFVDRRQFRPWLSVGTITAATTAPYLERLVEGLDSFRGGSWTIESVSLRERRPAAADSTEFREIDGIPLDSR